MLWGYKLDIQEKFKDYHYSSLNDKCHTYSQVYYPVTKEANLISEKNSQVIELDDQPEETDSFIEIMSRRRSYADSLENDVVISKKLISKFCHTAFFGFEKERRMYPSGGSEYSVNSYFIFNDEQVANELSIHGNICTLDFDNNNLLSYKNESWKDKVCDCFIQKDLYGNSKLAIVLGVDLDNISKKYTDISYKLVQLEAGHIGQNIQLAAALYGLKTVPLQGYYDIDLGRLIGNNQTILYAFLVG